MAARVKAKIVDSLGRERVATRASWGKIREVKLRSGTRYRASYVGHDGQRYTNPETFDTRGDAATWLAKQRTAMSSPETWRPPRKHAPTMFDEYARQWIAERTVKGHALKPRTRAEYERLLEGPLKTFHDLPLTGITPAAVRTWNADQARTGKVTQAARAYLLLTSVMAQAVADDIGVKTNPCKQSALRGAAKAKTGRAVEPPTDAELAIIVATIDPRFALLVEVAAWGSLRWGEVTELRRGDVSIDGDVVVLAIARAVTYTKDEGYIVGSPKSVAGIRTVALQRALTAPMRAHLAALGDPTDEALLFGSPSDPRKHLSAGSFAQYWRPARAAAGRDDCPFHALRHFGLTRYARGGATTKELMERAGHSDVATAMRYQHVTGRDAELAERMAN